VTIQTFLQTSGEKGMKGKKEKRNNAGKKTRKNMLLLLSSRMLGVVRSMNS
jgi:hypothetical protein